VYMLPVLHRCIVRLPRHISILCVGWTRYLGNVTEKQEHLEGTKLKILE